MQKALQVVEASFPRVVRLWIDGDDCEGGGGTLDSIDPGRTDRVVANSAMGDAKDAVRAIAGANEAFTEWSRKTPEERAEYLFQAARLMRLRKHDFSALMVFEVGKTWAEADDARDWTTAAGQGRGFLHKATQVKNIWVPYGA